MVWSESPPGGWIVSRAQERRYWSLLGLLLENSFHIGNSSNISNQVLELAVCKRFRSCVFIFFVPSGSHPWNRRWKKMNRSCGLKGLKTESLNIVEYRWYVKRINHNLDISSFSEIPAHAPLRWEHINNVSTIIITRKSHKSKQQAFCCRFLRRAVSESMLQGTPGFKRWHKEGSIERYRDLPVEHADLGGAKSTRTKGYRRKGTQKSFEVLWHIDTWCDILPGMAMDGSEAGNPRPRSLKVLLHSPPKHSIVYKYKCKYSIVCIVCIPQKKELWNYVWVVFAAICCLVPGSIKRFLHGRSARSGPHRTTP